MLAYNHEKYIAQAIDSILSQQVNFQFEIVIGEDCSTDNTRLILLDYWQKHPGVFKLLLHEKNVGPSKNHMLTMEACTAKYVAMCEGDDYWTSPHKLQEQVDHLEANPECNLSCHRVTHRQESSAAMLPWKQEAFVDYPTGRAITLKNIFDPYIISTVSVVYRNAALDIPKLKQVRFFKDLFLYSVLLENGVGMCMNKDWAVYRIHEQGIWSMQSQVKNLVANALTGLSITRYFKRSRKEVDAFAYYQTRNCFFEMGKEREKYKKEARYFAYTIAFDFGAYSSFSERIKCMAYLVKTGWPFVSCELPV